MKSARALSFVLLALSFAPTGLAQLISLWGRVLDSKGQPIVKAKITLTLEVSSPPFLASKLTNEDGVFFVSDLQPGNYTYVVEAAGYSKSIEAHVSLPPDVQPLEVVLQESPSSGDTITLRGLPETLRQAETSMGPLVPPLPRLQSYFVTVIPGISFTLLAEPGRPSATLSTDALLERFNRLRNEYHAEERKADLRAGALVRTLKARGQVGPVLEQRLRDFDSNNDRGLSNEEAKDEYPLERNEIVKRKLKTELDAFSHYTTTVRALRETVAELAVRHKFGLEEATEYSEFLLKNSLFGKEVDLPLVEGNPPDPAVLQHEKDVQNLLLALSRQPRSSKIAVITGSGIALGFLEADPAENEQELEVHGSVKLSRNFVPITRNISDPSAVYKIQLWIASDLPPGLQMEQSTQDIQSIANNGQLEPSSWRFSVKAGQPFKPFELRIRAELQQSFPGSTPSIRQPVEVPVSVVRIKPAPTRFQKVWATLTPFFPIAGIASLLLAFCVLSFGGQREFREFLVSRARKLHSARRRVLKAATNLFERMRRR